jgi:hypothetical protein
MEQEIQKRDQQIAKEQQSRLEEQTGIQHAYDEGRVEELFSGSFGRNCRIKKSK